ncbi:MAG: class I SAM-dependent methyltransferase [Clostridia bacterium]|nr:class I SAM-dependent methyltransferase [Clostridia bacterium]
MKYKIEKNSVQETLVIPLYGRKLCTELFPDLFRDDKAVELIGRLDYDFSELEKRASSKAYRFGALEVAMRQTDLSCEVKDYLKDHPTASVVNLGCGLDQTGESCDNGTCRIFNLDMPDVIAARNELLPPGERVCNLACDLNDFSWMDEILSGNGAVFFAAGVFYYFKTGQVRALFARMEERFPGGRLCFDAAGKSAVKIMLRTWVRQAGVTSIRDYFSVRDARKDLEDWFSHTAVSSRGYMLGYRDLKDRSVPGFFRLLSRIADNRMHMQIVKLEFGSREDTGDETGL